ncbi:MULTISPECIES: NADP-dependent oxidoreductase [unclassified Phenylobacterium]|uniref:NADP-dependent oxidoreductase n=1 Tax=unclassified Phenylobacterium TaxID=2640670 RepID=UPI00083A931B|nr:MULTISPECIES: NADP-dependent oxidoreductase [unclassified Phenylobacterium]
MSAQVQRQWQVAARPVGRPLVDGDFQLARVPVVAPRAGEVLVRTRCLGFDPAQKSWMENAASYMDPVEIGGVMPGSGVGVVVESAHPDYAPGDTVYGHLGWQELATVPASRLDKAPHGVSDEAVLSVLGGTGRTAYLALMKVGRPVAGDTLVISGAAGATGSLVGQLGKIAGCRVIGIAGGPQKCAWLTGELGFDAAIDYKSEKVKPRLRELAPAGVDIFFDNIGGELLNDVLARLALRARVVICGGISRYNFDPRSPQMPEGPRNYFNVVFTGATIQGFLMPQYERDYPEADARLTEWLRSGRIVARPDIVDGFENAPAALMRLFEGRNVGKQLLKVANS